MFNFIARMSLDASGFSAGVKRAEGAIASIGKKVDSDLKGKIAGAFGVGSIIAFASSVVNAADAIGDIADNAALSTDEVQRLRSVFAKFNIDDSGWQALLEKIRSARTEAINGSRDMQFFFDSMGIDQDKLQSLVGGEQLLSAIGAQLSKFEPNAQSEILAGIAGIKSGPRARGALMELASGKVGDRFQFNQNEIQGLSRLSDDLGALKRQSAPIGYRALDFVSKFSPLGILSALVGSDKKQSGQALAAAASEAKNKLLKLGPRPIPEKQQIDALESQRKISEEIFKLEFERLSYAEKRESLQKRIAGWMAIEADQAGTPEADIAKLNRLRAENELAQLSSPRMENISGNLTELQKIGAQVSESNAAMSILRDQLAVQKQISANTKPGPTGEGGFE